jgi:DNA-binding CsgD family transcriptional regulator
VAEVALLDELLGSIGERSAAVALVAGEAGMGKSRLVGELRQRAEAAGALVATGRTPVEGAALPYSTVMGLLRDLGRKLGPRETADLLDPVHALLTASPGDTAMPGAIARLQLFEAVLRAVEGLASEDRPAVFVLEDLHWADTGTVEIFDYLIRNLDHHAVLVTATYRSDEVERRPPLRRVLTELRRHPTVTTIELTGLTRDDVAALIADVAGEPQSWTVVDAVHRRSEGNPLFAEELVGVVESSDLPPALRDLLAVRIEQLPADARRLVASAAVLGVSCDHRLLAAVAALDDDALEAALADAVAHRVLAIDGSTGIVRFRHALLHEAAQTELLPAERARLHKRAANAIAADPSLAAAGPGHAAAELADHRFEAGEWAAACEASVSAADAALALYSLHAAYAHLRRAVEAHRLAGATCAHPDLDDAELYRRAAEAAALVGDLETSIDLAEAARDAMDPSAPLASVITCSLLIARSAWGAGRHEDAFAAVVDADALLGDMTTPEAAKVLDVHARLCMVAGRFGESIARGEEGLLVARACGARVTEAHVLATLGPSLVETGEVDRAVEVMDDAVAIAEAEGDPDLLIRVYTNLIHVLHWAGRLEDVARLVADAVRDTTPLGLMRLGGVGINGIDTLIVLGRWKEATELAALMDGKASAACASDTLNTALLALRRGDLATAESELGRQVPTAPQSIADYEMIVAEVALERGCFEDAAAAIDRSLATIAGTDQIVARLRAHALGLRIIADEAAQPVRRGRRASTDPAKAARLAESMLAEVETLIEDSAASASGPSPWVRALSAECRAEATRVLESDPSAWAAAATAWNDLSAPFHTAYCRFRQSEALLAGRSEKRAATDALVDAWRRARRLGAARLLGDCERLAERARITLDDPAGDQSTPRQRAGSDLGLTTREVEVLELLALGRTDGQIADTLFISKKTASVHVSNILRKLDARDRWHAGDIGRHARLGASG